MSKKIIAPVIVVAMVLSLVAAYRSSVDVASAAAQSVEHTPTHDDPGDYMWDSEAVTYIVLNGDSISVEGNGASANGSVVTIGSAGTYNVTGSLTNGQVIVDTQDEAIVRLILENATINNATSAPVFVANAEEAMIVLADNSQNYLTDGNAYVFGASGTAYTELCLAKLN